MRFIALLIKQIKCANDEQERIAARKTNLNQAKKED